MIATRRYARTQLETSTPPALLLELLDTALARTQAGIAALEAGSHAEAAGALTRASEIVTVLQTALDPARAPELVGPLGDVYTFAALRLTRAALRHDAESAREAERALQPIVEGFRTAIAGGTK